MSSLKAKIIGLVALAIGFLAVAADIKTLAPSAWSTLRDVPRGLVDTDVPLLVPICVAGISLLTVVIVLRRTSLKATAKERASDESTPTIASQDLLRGLSGLEEEVDRAAPPKRQSISNPKSLNQDFVPSSSPPRLEKQDFDG
jgi:hypothetical protein